MSLTNVGGPIAINLNPSYQGNSSSGNEVHIFDPPIQISSVTDQPNSGTTQSSAYYNDPSHIGVVNNGYNIEPIHYPETSSGSDKVYTVPNPNKGPVIGTPFIPKQREPDQPTQASSSGGRKRKKTFWDKNKSWIIPTAVGVGLVGLTVATGGLDLAGGALLAEGGEEVVATTAFNPIFEIGVTEGAEESAITAESGVLTAAGDDSLAGEFGLSDNITPEAAQIFETGGGQTSEIVAQSEDDILIDQLREAENELTTMSNRIDMINQESEIMGMSNEERSASSTVINGNRYNILELRIPDF